MIVHVGFEKERLGDRMMSRLFETDVERLTSVQLLKKLKRAD